MSKNIVIQEGGINKTLNAIKKIQTAKSGNGEVLWVPEEEVQLTSKHISKNGTYKASNDNAYGYKSVTVNVAGGNGSADSSGKPTGTVPPGGSGSAVTGKDPDTGNESVVGVDENGDLVTTKIPSSIKVTKLPDKTSYSEGQQIDYTGIAVSALDGNNNLMYMIPYSELIFTKHIVDQHSREEYHGNSWGANSEYLISQSGSYLGTVEDRVFNKYNDDPAIAVFRDGTGVDGWVGPMLISPVPEACYYTVNDSLITVIKSFEYDGMTWYVGHGWARQGANYSTSLHTTSIGTEIGDQTPAGLVNRTTLMTMVGAWGEGGAPDTSVPVNWQRPYDNKVLTDSFEITVTSSTSSNVNNSGGDIDYEYTGPQE